MRYINTLSLALALAAIPTSLAQTFSDCDPTKKTGCPSKPGLTQEYSVDFRKGAESFKEWTTTSGVVKPVTDGAEFKIEKIGDGPTIQSNFYMFFGYAEVVMKSAPGAGIVSSFVMQSDDLDEIDWEWIGSDTVRSQSNYFGKGNTTTYDRGQFHPVSAPEATFTKYAVNWTAESTTWLINDAPIRTLNFADANGGQNYPQTPMNIRIGNWVAGAPGNSPGTIEWAGGLADFSKGPFSMMVQSVRLVNYNPGASYAFGDQSGSWQSIKIEGGVAPAPIGAAPAPIGAPESSKSNSTTGPGDVPYSGSSGSGSGQASGVASGLLPTYSVNLGGSGANGGNNGAAAASGSGAVPSEPCSTVTGTNSGETAAAAASGGIYGEGATPATVSIKLGSGMPGGSMPTGLGAASNSTNSGNGGIVAQGAPSNATVPTYTINAGGNSGNGAAATEGSNTATTLATQATDGTTNPAQTSFGLQNGTSTSTGGPQQVTTSAGSRASVGWMFAVVAVAMLFM
ncbi:concanavalin A-like lectin/glucanase [Tothia fuscella]|uniref:Crh-like protein n=1 Tax=Tothia fuscella TaxID=1048955 RepID=A0A9P4NF80_9PEZI|nr:concanavalin A-like lectin/glucanase [Tothia fuscella]